MKVFVVTAVTLAVLATPASAQMGGKRNRGDDQKAAPTAPKVDEKAYKAALEKIPDSKEKYDPWAVAKPADTATKKPK
jgi:hypothetical protein